MIKRLLIVFYLSVPVGFGLTPEKKSSRLLLDHEGKQIHIFNGNTEA